MKRRGFFGMLAAIVAAPWLRRRGEFVITEIDHEARSITFDWVVDDAHVGPDYIYGVVRTPKFNGIIDSLKMPKEVTVGD